jgi:hypothetical protein
MIIDSLVTCTSTLALIECLRLPLWYKHTFKQMLVANIGIIYFEALRLNYVRLKIHITRLDSCRSYGGGRFHYVCVGVRKSGIHLRVPTLLLSCRCRLATNVHSFNVWLPLYIDLCDWHTTHDVTPLRTLWGQRRIVRWIFMCEGDGSQTPLQFLYIQFLKVRLVVWGARIILRSHRHLWLLCTIR